MSKISTELKHYRVLVTPTSFGISDPSLRTTLEQAVGEVIYNSTGKPLKADAARNMIRDIDGYIAGLDEIDANVLQVANRLKVIARYGVGTERVDLQAATERGIVVTNTPGANSASVAELTIGLILALCRKICLMNQSTQNGEWLRSDGISLRNKVVGLVGLGSIGLLTAIRLKAFDCQLLATDPYIDKRTADQNSITLVPLEELLGKSDILSLHVPLLPETERMVNQDFLARMKPGALLINTARGQLIDEEAVAQALESGYLRGLGLDLYRIEPPGSDYPLFRCPQVIATPHMGAHTDDATNEMGRMSVEDCLAVLQGKRPPHVVNPEVYERNQKGGKP